MEILWAHKAFSQASHSGGCLLWAQQTERMLLFEFTPNSWENDTHRQQIARLYRSTTRIQAKKVLPDSRHTLSLSLELLPFWLQVPVKNKTRHSSIQATAAYIYAV